MNQPNTTTPRQTAEREAEQFESELGAARHFQAEQDVRTRWENDVRARWTAKLVPSVQAALQLIGADPEHAKTLVEQALAPDGDLTLLLTYTYSVTRGPRPKPSPPDVRSGWEAILGDEE